MHPVRPSRAPLSKLWLLGAMFVLSVLSCGREITGPSDGVGQRYAHGMSFLAVFPGSFASLEQGAGSVVPFTRVRVFFLRMDGSVALDRMVEFPEGSSEVTLSLSIPLANDAPPEGEPLELFLRYIDAAGDTVFAGGPVAVVAAPTTSGGQPTTPTVPLAYTGPGAEATGVVMAPDTILLNAGEAFAFTAVAHDAQMVDVETAPLVWSSLDPTKASVGNAGTGAALGPRGEARIRVALAAGGAADTALLIIAPVRSVLVLASGGGQSGSPGVTLADSIKIRVNATDELPLEGVAVSLAVTTGGGEVSESILVSDANGIVAFEWTLGATVGTQSITATATGMGPLVVTATAVSSGPALLAITQQPPVAATAGDTIAPIILEVRTAAQVLSGAYADSITIAIASGPADAVLLGRKRVLANAGIVTFDSLSFTKAGNYTLSVTAPGLTAATTGTITVAAAAPDAIELVSGGSQSSSPGTALPDPIVVRVVDAYANPVANVALNFTVEDGASAAPPTMVTSALGIAQTVWTLREEQGTQTLIVSAVDFAIDQLTVLANNETGPIVVTTITQAPDTLVSLNEQAAFEAESYDVQTNVIVGSYTWSSSDPLIATVDQEGVVTALANGVTNIIALEAGGTADTVPLVVAQKLSSITVTPSPRQIYLGASYAFSAQAVDGGGSPLGTQPIFAWDVTNGAVAAVTPAGLVSTLGLGTSQVRAESNGIIGVANITVITPITRIAVIRDSVSFVSTDTFTIVALNRTRSYRAVAYDTLDAPMAGIAFTWVSSNPTVAALDSTGSATTRARAAANGLTSVRASAQGVQGSASLRVQQLLADIELTPNVATIGPTGSVLLTARGVDPDGSNLPSISGVNFTSIVPAIATVNASTGLVTGVAPGTALITANRDTILADTVTITVGEGAPAIISFGRDSLSIGRSGSQSIPIYLSRPSLSPVTVNLAVADTFAYFSTASITIPAGSTAGNATLNGRNAGSTQIYATDAATTPVYAGDTATLGVQANVRFSTTSYSLVATQSTSTQIVLSDPAPAGGTFVTYAYGTAGRAEISPDPAFIPAGQLTVNVVITALAGGNTTVTPVAAGATGQTATVNTYAASLDIGGASYRLGDGTYRTDAYVQTAAYLTSGLPVTLTSSDTSVAVVESGNVINAGSYFFYFRIDSRGTGSAYIKATSPGFTPDSALIIVSSPKITVCCSTSRLTTSGPSTFGVTVRDSVNGAYARQTPLVVNYVSRDTTIVKLTVPQATIGVGSTSSNGGTYIPGGEIGSTYIVGTASGMPSDSILITVTGPKLSFSFGTARVGLGQRNSGGYVSIPNNTPVAKTVYLQSGNPGITAPGDSVIIPANSYYVYFNLDGLALGTDTLYASTSGHEPDTAFVIVSSPRLQVTTSATYDNFRPPVGYSVAVRDSVGGAYARLDTLDLSLESTNPAVITVTPTGRILPGSTTSQAGPQVTIVGEGTALVIATAPGHVPDTTAYTVRTPKLSFSWNLLRIGRRQFTGNTQLYVSVPNNVTDTLPITITHSNPAVDSLLPNPPNIPPGTYFRYFYLYGLEFGTDTLIASAPGYLPDTAIVVVNTPRFILSNLPATRTTTSPPSTFNVTAVDSVGNGFRVMDTVVVSVQSTNPGVLQTTLPQYRFLPGAMVISPQVSFVGPGTGAIVVSDSAGSGYANVTTNTVTVTGPSLQLQNNNPRLGMRQNGGTQAAYVYTANNVTGSPLWVRLVSTDPSVATVPDSVQIPVGTYFAYFTIRAQDVVGTVQIQASATGYSPATANQEVTAPRFLMGAPTSMRATQAPATVTVYVADATGAIHYSNEDVVVELGSSDPGVAFIDSATVTILANAQSNNRARVRPVVPGTIQLSATDPRSDPWRYSTGTGTLAVTVPNLTLNWSSPTQLGIGQYVDQSVSVPDNRASPLIVSFAHATPNSATPDTVTVNTGTSARVFRLSGVSEGVDTVRVSATGYNGDFGPVLVGMGRVDGLVNWPTTLNADSVLVTLRSRAPNGTIRAVVENTTFNLAVDANLEFWSGGANSAQITSVMVPADGSQVAFYLKRTGVGTANVTISAANYVTYNAAVTVNAP